MVSGGLVLVIDFVSVYGEEGSTGVTPKQRSPKQAVIAMNEEQSDFQHKECNLKVQLHNLFTGPPLGCWTGCETQGAEFIHRALNGSGADFTTQNISTKIPPPLCISSKHSIPKFSRALSPLPPDSHTLVPPCTQPNTVRSTENFSESP